MPLLLNLGGKTRTYDLIRAASQPTYTFENLGAIVLDKPSLGPAPIVIDNMFETICRLNRELGLAILVVEQM